MIGYIKKSSLSRSLFGRERNDADIFVIAKVCVAVFVYSLYTVTALISNPKEYGDVLYVAFIAKFLQSLQFGAVSGYLFQSFSLENKIIEKKAFVVMYGAQLVFLSMFLIVVSASLHLKNYTVGLLVFITLIPLYCAEPALRVERKFIFSLLPELCVASSIAIVFLANNVYRMNSEILLNFVALSSLVVVSIIIIAFKKTFSLVVETAPLFQYKTILVKYAKLVMMGFPQYVATTGFMLLMFIDRWFISHYNSASFLGVFMYSFQIVSGGGVVISSMSVKAKQ